MHKYLVLAAVAAMVSACSPAGNGDDAGPASLDSEAQKFGYAIGIDLGRSLQPVEDEVDVSALKQGLDDVLAGREPRLDEAARDEVKNTVAQRLQAGQMAEQAQRGQQAAEAGRAFLAENAERDGVETTESGLQYEILEEGEGASPTAQDSVTVHYRGTLIDGTEFDSSYARGEPVTFPLGNVIAGWTEGLQLMKAGGKAKLFIPSDLGYGAGGAGSRIGPNETLIFEVELLEIQE
jgi:FKBP-type peptidyl-prolyl cis-trans isomerase FkpA